MPQLDPIKTSTDRDGDVIMSDVPPASISIKDKSIFDWFSFEGKTALPKSPTYSPASPNQNLNLSASTASPSTYFSISQFSPGVRSRCAASPQEATLSKVKYPAPPAKALKWIWQCHLCSSRYPLAVTRRCLNDGHYYCSGSSQTQRNVKKRRRNQSCTSEFDYVAWKEWGQWRRKMMALRAFDEGQMEPKLLGCEGCNSPSQCRYESWKRVEVLKFDDYIEEDDLSLSNKKDLSFDQSNHEGKFGSMECTPIASREEEKDTKCRKLTSKRGLKIDSTSLSSVLGQKSAGRHRFYSSLSGSLSNRDLSPTTESQSTERGRFDPLLPSVIKSAQKEKEELMAMESTLKATLAKQKQQTPPTAILESPSYVGPKTKRRLNTETDDPSFEVIARDVLDGAVKLQRTMSQPSLLTDFFRQCKPQMNVEPSPGDNIRRAESEAEITAFLRSASKCELDEVKARTKSQSSVPANNVQHFEDVELSTASNAVAP